MLHFDVTAGTSDKGARTQSRLQRQQQASRVPSVSAGRRRNLSTASEPHGAAERPTVVRRRLRTLVSVSLLVVLAGCGALGADLDWEPAELGRSGWEGARTSADGRSILITVMGGPELDADDHCTMAYRAVVDETPSEVRVEVLSASPSSWSGGSCNDAGYMRAIDVDLAQPLAGRRLVQVDGERERPVFDGSLLVEPSWLPDGWKLKFDGPGYPNPERVTSWARRWAADRPPPVGRRCIPTEAGILLTQGSKDLPEAQRSIGDNPVRAHDLNGHTASYQEGGQPPSARLSWSDGEHGFVLETQSGCEGDTLPSEETLLRFTRGLRSAPR